MKKFFIATALALSLTSCAEITDGLRDISQGTFLKKRLPNPFEEKISFYDSLVNLSLGKATNSTIKLSTSNEITFKSLNVSTLEQSGEPNGFSWEILEKELAAYNIKLKQNRNSRKCKSDLDNGGFLVVSIYEFILNGKKLHFIDSGHLGSGNYPNPIIITRDSPCKVLDSIHL